MAVLLLGSCGGRYGRFNPTVTVDVRHPPSVGILVEEVVFAPPDPSAAPPDRSFLARLEGLFTRSEWLDTGACRAELEQALTQMFIEAGLRVARYGSHENADAMIGLDVTRCVVGQDREEITSEVIEEFRGNTRRREVREYHASTQLDFTALFEVTDLWTDRVVASRTLAFAPELVDSSLEDYPDYPPTGAVLQLAYALAAEDIGPVLLEQVEARNLIFFDDERCGLNRAFRALEAGDQDRALELSLANVESCRPDPVAEITHEDVAAAHYNVGVLYRIMGDFESALENLERARQEDPANSVIADAIEESLSAESVAADLMAALGGGAVTTTAGDARPTSETTVENPDRAALAALYEATDGPNWRNNTRWLTDAPLADWAGVRTDNSDRVTDLRLSQNRLSGQIPPEIGNLSNLMTLSLSGNRVSGQIPPEIGNLSNLRSLWLLGTDLSGPIPPEIGNLANLEELLLGGNISGRLPPELGDLASLTSLWLDNSDVSGPLPPELGDLANLTLLRLEGTDLSGRLPPELGNLTSLTNLELANNALSGPLPPELGDLANLTNLEAPNNAFSGALPPELGNLGSLTNLHVQGNELSGPIPPELGGVANLRTLWFNDNELSGPIPSELGDLANLNNLWLAKNNLSGPLPPELGDLANLTNLDLQENDLSGPVPSSLLQLARLNALHLSGNSLCMPNTTAYTAWLRGIGRNDADMLSACDAVDPVRGEQSTVDRARQLEEEAAQGADQVLANDDAPPVVGITWFAEHLNEANLLEQWQIILEGDSAGAVKGTLHHWLIDGGKFTDGWDAGPVTGTYSFPDVALSWAMEAFIVTLSCELTGIMAPAGDAIHGTVACVPDIGNRKIIMQLRFDRTYG